MDQTKYCVKKINSLRMTSVLCFLLYIESRLKKTCKQKVWLFGKRKGISRREEWEQERTKGIGKIKEHLIYT